MSLPINPYIAGAPLRGEKGFFGRQGTLEWVQRELRNPHTNALVLFGQRRIGKTTLLLQLARNLPADEFLSIYFDLQDQATRPLGQTLRDLADILCEKANLDLGQLGPFDDQGRYFQKDFLPRFYTALGDERRPVFLLDEFDVLDQTAEAALVETATAKTLFPLLRRLITTDARSAFVFVVGRRAEDLSLDFSATFKASLVREVWVLDNKSAEELVRQGQLNGTLKFTAGAIKRILSLTNCHPYLTQLLCQRIWELAYASRPSSPPKIDTEQVETALISSLETGNQALDWLWNGLNPAEKIYASALAEIAGENETIPEERIIEVLATHAARLRTREIELAPRDLVKRHVLNTSGERGYRFAIEIFRRWVQKNKPLMVVKDEVDRIDPMADRLFMFGDGFYDARQWEKAAYYFREALYVNPRHFRARLYLGETLLEQGMVDEAITELDQALILDREEARLPLARAWLAKAEMLEPGGDLDLLSQAYERVLELSPKESQALRGKASVWTRRAQLAEEGGDLAAALEAYQKAGDQASIERLKRREQERLLEELRAQAQQHVNAERWEAAAAVYAHLVENALDEANRLVWQAELEKSQAQAAEESARAKARMMEEMRAEAQVYEQHEEWEKAISVYERLIESDRENDWKSFLENAQTEQGLAALFEQGQQAIQEEDWKEAQRFLAQIIHVRPDYRRNGLLAVALLYDAVTHRKGTRWQDWLPRLRGSLSKPILQPAPLPRTAIDEESNRQKRRRIQGIVILILIMLLMMPGLISLSSPDAPTGAIETTAPEATQGAGTAIPLAFADPHPDSSDRVDSHGVPMRFVEAGEFEMGSGSGGWDEVPVHTVSLDAFYIDKYEVTNAWYRACVDSGQCSEPRLKSSKTRPNYYGTFEFSDFPVIHVNWNMAAVYCQWRGGKLPTEAQWEKAARGTVVRTFPMGEVMNLSLANYGRNLGDTAAIGANRENRSPYGVYDMAGNVWEWVADWYSSYYYQDSPPSNPPGPPSGEYRVFRGGGWSSEVSSLRTTERSSGNTEGALSYTIGFRCVKTSVP